MQANTRLKESRALLGPHPGRVRPRAKTLKPPTNHPTSDELRLAIHDRLGPGLVNIEVRLQLVEESLAAADPNRGQIVSLRQEASLLVTELRRLIQAQPPARLEEGGLVSAVRSAVDSAARTGLEMSFTVTGTPIEPPVPVSEVVYQAALEGIANVVRHAGATHCQVTLHLGRESLMLAVRDDGVGPHTQSRCTGGRHVGIGMSSLRKSARCLGGETHLLSRAAGGTSLVLKLPLSAHSVRRRLSRVM